MIPLKHFEGHFKVVGRLIPYPDKNSPSHPWIIEFRLEGSVGYAIRHGKWPVESDLLMAFSDEIDEAEKDCKDCKH